jgi:hypothetical protein
MAMFGLTIADYVEEYTALVWLTNLDAVNLFVQLGTQWLVGPGGPYGLNYATLYLKMDRLGLSPKRQMELEEDIRILEDAALAEMRKDN